MKKRIPVFFIFLSILFLDYPLPAEGNAGSLQFGGYTWEIKASQKAVGPGPNVYSASTVGSISPREVALQIKKIEGKWYCSEIYTNEFFTYGEFSVKLILPEVTDFRSVFGFFLYNEKEPPFYNEVDFEISSWGDPALLHRFQFTVQPYERPGNLYSFSHTESEDPVIVTISWKPSEVHFSLSDSEGQSLQSWIYTGSDLPDSPYCRVHLNFWLFEGESPGTDVMDMNIKDFRYQPIIY